MVGGVVEELGIVISEGINGNYEIDGLKFSKLESFCQKASQFFFFFIILPLIITLFLLEIIAGNTR